MAFKKSNLPWNKGKKGLQVAWNKNIPMKEESRRKSSEAHKGKIPWNKGKKGIYSKEVLEKNRLAHLGKTPWLGKRHSEESKIKNKLAHLGKTSWNKGKKIPEISGKNHPMFGKHHSEKSRKKMKEIRLLHPNRYWLGKKHPEIAESSRARILRMYESGSFPKQTNTDIEIIMKNELLKRGYKEGKDFIHQFKFHDKFMCDFVFPMQKVVIECDGNWHHAHPKTIKEDKLHYIQKKDLNRDKSKNAYIQKVDNGSWRLLRFWGSDIKKDISKCVDKIEEVL